MAAGRRWLGGMGAALLVACSGGGAGEAGEGVTDVMTSAGDPDAGGPATPGADTGPGADTSADTGVPTTGGPTMEPDLSAGPGDPDTSGDPDTGGDLDTGGDPSGDPTGEACEAEMHAGMATYYAADGSGNCSFDAAPGDPLVAAMNHTDYALSAACGACVAIDGPDGSTTVRIVDRCPECPQGHIDLHPDAFAMLADPQLGVVPIAWRYVSCPVAGDIVYHFKEGSNEWWTAVQVRGHRNAIATFEYRDTMGSWKAVERVDYNYFLDASGMGPGPYEFRVTDVHGNVLTDSGVPFVEAGDSPGAGQFPACAG